MTNPNYPAERGGEANAPDAMKALEQARSHLQKAASLPNQTSAYLHMLAQAEFMAGAYEAAEAACEKSLLSEAANYEGLLLLAETRLRLKRSGEAWQAAKQAVRLDKHREEAWLLAARAAIEGGQNESAIECLELYLKVNKDQLVGPLAYILLARVYLNIGAPDQALEHLEQAQSRLKAMFIAPGPTFVALRARVLRSMNKSGEAMEHYERAVKAAPHDATLHNEMGEALVEQGRTEDALRVFRKALELEPTSAVYHSNAGKAALKSAAAAGQGTKRAEAFHQQAVELLSKSTLLEETEPKYWHELALAYNASRNHKLARNALTQAIAQSPAIENRDSLQAQYLRLYARTCQKLGEFDEAHGALNQVLNALPDDHETMNELGELNYKTGNFSDAFNAFRRAELAAPDHHRYLANMSRALLKMERLEEARDLIQEASGARAADHYVKHQMGAVLLESGKPAEALDHLLEAASCEPDNADFRYYLGRAYLKLGKISEAIHEYQEAVSNAPNQHAWHSELGEVYLKEKSYLPALESLRIAVQIEPSLPAYRYNLAIALAANGDLWGAVHTLREVMAALGMEIGAEWHYLLGRLLLELNRYDEALDSFAEAHRLEPGNPHYKVDLAKTLRLKGEPIEQIKILLEEAIAVDPQRLQSFQELAFVYEASDNPEAALRALESHLDEVLATVKAS